MSEHTAGLNTIAERLTRSNIVRRVVDRGEGQECRPVDRSITVIWTGARTSEDSLVKTWTATSERASGSTRRRRVIRGIRGDYLAIYSRNSRRIDRLVRGT